MAVREADLALPAAALRELAGLVHLAEAGSTQDEAFARPPPPRGALVVVADRQSGGRGRLGRTWFSDPDGGLAFTVLRRFDLPPRALSALGPVVGIALAQALRGLGAGVGVKWPNDLVHDDAKLGGVLIEVRGSAVAIGVGLNLAVAAVPGIEQAWTDLARAGAPGLPRSAVLSTLLATLLPALAEFERDGFAAFREAWAAVDTLAGRPVRIHAAAAADEGIALGIADDGGLRVRHALGERIHHAGEVSVRVVA